MSDETELAIGDIVRLKSGGPVMTVANLPSETAPVPEGMVKCQWFVRGDTAAGLQEADFHPNALEKI